LQSAKDMASPWEALGSTYVEAATTAFPLHRAVLFGAGLIGSIAVHRKTQASVFGTIAQYPLADIASLSTGPLSKATIADVMVALAAVFLGWGITRIGLQRIFAMAARMTDLWENIEKSELRMPIKEDQPLADRQKALELIDGSLKEPRARLRSINALAELTCGIGVASLASSYWGNWIDAAIGGTSLIASLALQVVAVRFFLAEYLGPALSKARIQGKKPPGPSSAI